MLSILDNKYQAKLFKNLGNQFVFLAKKLENSYQILSNLVKITSKTIVMARNTIFNLFAKLQPYIITNKRKDEYCINRFEAIN